MGMRKEVGKGLLPLAGGRGGSIARLPSGDIGSPSPRRVPGRGHRRHPSTGQQRPHLVSLNASPPMRCEGSDLPRPGEVPRQAPCFSAIMTWRMDGPREVSAALPVGTVTFVLGDVARSTRLWEDMAADVIGKCIEYVKGRLPAAAGAAT